MFARNLEEARAAILSALGLLMDKELEWSADFTNLKPILCVILHDNLIASKPNKNIISLAEKLVDTHG
jgi:hypothetical protein